MPKIPNLTDKKVVKLLESHVLNSRDKKEVIKFLEKIKNLSLFRVTEKKLKKVYLLKF
jgi:hypothetical protein